MTSKLKTLFGVLWRRVLVPILKKIVPLLLLK